MNSNSIDIKVVAKDIASDVIKGVSKEIKDMGSSAESTSKQSSVLTGVVAGLTTAVVSFGLSIISSSIDNLAGWFSDAVEKASQLETSLKVLAIVAPRFGVGAEEATEAAKKLGLELKIGIGPAAESLQNLLKSGLNLGQATELMRRFTNEAMTGKSPTISLSQAVSNLSFAYQTNNSALGNLSGIAENWSDITEKGRQTLLNQGMALANITDDMAKYQGVLDLTNLTLGSSDLLTDTYASKQIVLNQKLEQFQTNIGSLLLPILAQLTDVFSNLFDQVSPKLQEWAGVVIPEIGRIFRDEVVPEIKKFIDYLGSPQFKTDVDNLRKDFEDFKNTVTQIWGIFKGIWGFVQSIVNALASVANFFNSIGGAGIAQSYLQNKYGTPLAEGTNYVPYDGFRATLHKGEAVVPAKYNNSSNPTAGTQVVNNFYGYDTAQISSTINNQINLGY